MRALRHSSLCAVATLAVLLLTRTARAQTHDPTLHFATLEAPHFRIHYYQGLELIAQRVAAIGEGVYQSVGSLMGWHPHQRVEILLTDNTDDSNGSATIVPYNTIRLFVTAPDDLSELNDYDDYLQQLLTHEFTHIAHMDNVSGLPAIINAILGKVYPPNGLQPSWMLEGIAVVSETLHTTGGRLRSSEWNMFMRADALANHFVSLDQLSSGPPLRWPHGQIAYLYGSFFMQYIVERFGAHVFADIATYTGRQLIPAALNRSVRRATGYTYEELYRDFLDATRQRCAAERDAVVAQGLREGERITFQGEDVRYPRFLPDGHTVAFQSQDGHSHTQIRTIDVGTVGGPIARARGGPWTDAESGFALNSDASRMVVSDTGFFRDIYFYRELYERSVHVAPDGAIRTANNHAITDGTRATNPSYSPDDDHIAFTVNHRGTSSLFEMSLTEREPRGLFRVRRYEQVFTPRYSPDGNQIAFSHWQRGGLRDVRIYDRTTHAIRDVTHDRALDMQPEFTPDGRYVLFASDRSGIFNIYAYELATGALRQVTNVVHGAFMPAISRDGRTLVYVGYGTNGWDLYRMRFDPASWTDAGASRERGGTLLPTPPVAAPVHSYQPWNTFRPRYWYLSLGNDGFGPQLAVLTQGSDIVGNHTYLAQVALGLTRGDPSFDVSYFYSGLRPTLRMHGYRVVNAAPWRIGRADLLVPYDRFGGETELSVSFPSLFATNSLAVSYEASYAHVIGPVAYNQFVDPNQPLTFPPFEGWLAGLRASWGFSHVHRWTYGIGNADGFEASLSVHGTDRVLGSRFGSFDFSTVGAFYIPTPWRWWRVPHELAVRAAGGLGITDTNAPALFTLGGFPTYGFTDFVSSFVSLSVTGGVALRGYPRFARRGNAFFLVNLEYRFPILQLDRGASTLPVYIARFYGALALDIGNAFFFSTRLEDTAVGVGAELFTDFVVGWYFRYTLRLGIARGVTGPDGQWQGYALLSAPF